MHQRILALTLFAALLAVLATGLTGHAAVFGDELLAKYKELLESGKVSPQTATCINCHIVVTPTIVYEWLNSKHAWTTPADLKKLYEAIGEPEWWDKVADKFKNYKFVVGCYECHGMYADSDRPDIVEHVPGLKIVTVVTRKDCGQCHPKEDAEISWTWHATGAIMSPVKPWYAAIVKYAKSKGADPFGSEEAKKIYAEYLPPYLLKQRGKEPVYWDFYKKIAKAVMEYVMTGKEDDIVKMLKEATGMVVPYDLDWKKWVSPLWPASGVLNNTVLARYGIKIPVTAMDGTTAVISNVMSHPTFRNAYVYHACLECHGSIVIPYGVKEVERAGFKVKIVELWGWPNNGAGRVDPDGSMGTCTACHPRHLFSVKQARKPWTCGQCHLGYDHPHIEIYEESKHGNIENAYGDKWNWERIPWRVGVDFNAPTCATCHMSTISVVLPNGTEKIVVHGTHDLVRRLVWDQMHFFSHPKPVIPDNVQTGAFLAFSVLKGKYPEDVMAAYEKTGRYPVFMGIRIRDECKPGTTCFPRLPKVELYGELAKHREEMMKVCKLCHSSQWVEHYFRTADQNLVEYDIVARFAFSLLQLAWKEGIHDKSNIIDEYMEIMWYYIWHHDGRRWRNGATMMGPDYAHWFGIVDTVMDKLGRMISYLATALEIKAVKEEIEALKKAAAGAPYAPELAAKIEELKKRLEELKARLEALEAQVPALKSKLASVEEEYYSLESKLSELEKSLTATSGEVATVKADVKTLVSKLEELSKQLAAITPKAEKIEEMVAKLKEVAAKLEELKSKVEKASSKASQAATKAEEAASKASEAVSKAEEASRKVEDLSEQVSATGTTVTTLAGIALAVAVIALGLAIIARRR